MRKDTKTMLFATGWLAFILTVIGWVTLVCIVLIIEYSPQILEWYNTHLELINIYGTVAASFFLSWGALFALYLFGRKRGEDEE